MGDSETIQMAIDYYVIIGCGLVFHFIGPIYSATFNAAGNSLTPFIINSIGLVTNVILDPVLIFGIGPFPKMGIKGAALATVAAQIVITLIFILASRKTKYYFPIYIF